MKKRKFGMACLNVTQGRYSNGSHKYINAYDLAGIDTGIDRWRTWNDLEVIGVHPYATTGFANTVHFYDAENDVTIAMTHCNTIPDGCVVGHVFHSGDTCYYEGTKGRATGNHIHLEIGKGRQPNKVKAYNGGWGLRDFINVEDYFYIDRAYTTIKSDGGYAFSYSAEDSKPVRQEIPLGYSTRVWNGNLVHLYRQDIKNREIGMMSASGTDLMKAVQDITDIDDDRVHYAKINCNYFINVSGDRYGEHLGVEQSPTVNAVPRQGNNYLAFWIDLKNQPHYDYSSNYWLEPSDVKLACSPACIMLFDGNDEDIISVGLGDKRNTASTQTVLMRMPEDGSYVFCVTATDNFNAYNCRQMAKDFGSDLCVLFDSGGSSQMVADGKAVVHTGRKIPNVLTIYAKPAEEPAEGGGNGETGHGGTVTHPDENEALKAQIEALQKENETLKGQVIDLEEKAKEAVGEYQEMAQFYSDARDLIESIQKITNEYLSKEDSENEQ